MKERIPPNAIEAEQSALGSMMIERSALLRGLELLSPGDFYRPVHSTIFQSLGAMAHRGEPVDLITLQEELKKHRQLTEVGGTEYLMSCTDRVPTAANLEHYAGIVLEKAKRRRVIAACAEVTATAFDEDSEEDPTELFTAKALTLSTKGEKDGPRKVEGIIHEHWDRLEARKDRQDSKQFSSGFPTMDKLFGYLGEAYLVVLKGRRKKGKTHCVAHLARQASFKGRATVMYSLEMSEHHVINRLAACFGNVDSRLFHRLTDEDWPTAAAAMGELAPAPIWVCDKPRTVARMASECRRLKIGGAPLGLVTVDFAELITAPPGQRSEEQELKTNARLLGDLAVELDCTVLLVSQANKEGGERGSEGIGNRCDLMLALSTDDGVSAGTLRGEFSRFGPPFKIPVRIDKATSRMGEVTQDRGDSADGS